MITIQRSGENIYLYMDRLANKTIRAELSNEKLPESLKRIVALPTVKTTNDALEALVDKIQGQIGALFQSDPLIQAGLKREPHPPEQPAKLYTSSIVDAVTEKLSDWKLSVTA